MFRSVVWCSFSGYPYTVAALIQQHINAYSTAYPDKRTFIVIFVTFCISTLVSPTVELSPALVLRSFIFETTPRLNTPHMPPRRPWDGSHPCDRQNSAKFLQWCIWSYSCHGVNRRVTFWGACGDDLPFSSARKAKIVLWQKYFSFAKRLSKEPLRDFQINHWIKNHF